MDAPKLPFVDVGDHVFLDGQPEEIGAVREVAPDGKPQLLIYVENGGEFLVPLTCVARVTVEKVVLDPHALPEPLRRAIGRAHAGEQPGL